MLDRAGAVTLAIALGCSPPRSAPIAVTAPPPPPMFRQIKSERSLVVHTTAAPFTLADHVLSIDGREIALQGDGDLPAIAHGIARVPPELRALITSIAISATPNPTDAAFAKKYGMPVTAGMTANADGEITIYPYGIAELREEDWFVRNLMHELGHTWTLHAWRADPAALRAWLAAIANDRAAPSEYAMTSFATSGWPTEDGAEATALYFCVRGTSLYESFRAEMPARFALIASRFPSV